MAIARKRNYLSFIDRIKACIRYERKKQVGKRDHERQQQKFDLYLIHSDENHGVILLLTQTIDYLSLYAKDNLLSPMQTPIPVDGSDGVLDWVRRRGEHDEIGHLGWYQHHHVRELYRHC